MRKDREAAKRLLHAIGDIDAPYLLEAEEQPMKQTKKQISNRWMKYIAVAACAGIVLTAALLQYERSKSQSPLTPSATQTEPATTEKTCRFPTRSSPVPRYRQRWTLLAFRWMLRMPMGHMTTRPFRQSKGK